MVVRGIMNFHWRKIVPHYRRISVSSANGTLEGIPTSGHAAGVARLQSNPVERKRHLGSIMVK
ncbi:MAG: hypothetical protein ACLTJ5_03755 [Clostridium sp.]